MRGKLPMMGRRRKHRLDLPARVYFRHGAYYFVGRSGEWIRLGTDVKKALRRYTDLIAAPGLGRMGEIMDRYLREVVPKKAPRTRANNEREIEPLRAVFGHMEPDEITPQDIYAYMDHRRRRVKRRKPDGTIEEIEVPAPIAANREVALLSSIFSHAIRWGLASDNPCRLVVRNTETPRRRYVEEHEYRAVYAIAPPIIQCAMDIARLTGLRLGDILRLNERDNIREDGLYVETGKTGKRLLFEWTEELRAVIDRARALRGKVRGLTIIATQTGQTYTLTGFEAIWQRVMKRAVSSGAIAERFRFHDLRALAADRAEQPSELLGHDDPRVTNRIYRRGPRRVKPAS